MCINNRNRILEIRREAGLTQAEMAKLLKTSRQNYSFWETNAKFIPLKHLHNFCNKFKVSMDYVFYLTNDRFSRNEKTYNLNKQIVGKNLEKFLEVYGLTQQQLADFLNTSQSTISAYINGKTMILTAFLYQIAKKYKLSMDKFCGRY